MKILDLRSDTVTQPTTAMRRAMAAAEVGDDFYRDDPTVVALEEKAAALLGKPAAMLVLSGTMGNLVSLLAAISPGDAVLLADNSHIYMNEAGGVAAVAGLLPMLVSRRLPWVFASFASSSANAGLSSAGQARCLYAFPTEKSISN